MNVTSIILAAGEGKRINHKAKGTLIINGEQLLQRQVRLLAKRNIDSYIVTGCYKTEIESAISGCKFIYNPYYQKENWLSLKVALAYFLEKDIKTDFLICDGDIVYEESLLDQILHQEKTSYLIDFSKKRPDDMGVLLDGNNKVISFSKTGIGSGIGLIYVKYTDAKILYEKLKKATDNTWWINYLPIDNLILVKVIKGTKWTEIDTEEDYNKAKVLFEMSIKLDEVYVEELFELMNQMKFEGFHLDKRTKESEEKVLSKSLSFTVRHNGKLIGYARVWGDFTYYWSVWDVMILPEYQGYGIGYDLMNCIMSYIKQKSYIKIFLFSAKGKENFYSNFGFKISRANVMEIRND